MDFMNIRRMRESTLRRFLAEPTIDEEIVLHDIDCRGSHGKTDNCEFAREQLERFRTRAPGGVIPPPLVRGDDLIAMGMKPGPRFKTLLRKVQDAQLEGSVVSREDALAMLGRIAAGVPNGTMERRAGMGSRKGGAKKKG
jgi:poly(A) polymerase